jgi:hypothetical protein
LTAGLGGKFGDNNMASLGTMIEQLDGMRDTSDLTEWENDFVTSILERYLAAKKDTRNLSAKQVEIVERIWSKHFAA